MNLHRYRQIFDRLRGCLVAVSELAHSQCKAARSARGIAAPPASRLSTFSLMWLPGAMSAGLLSPSLITLSLMVMGGVVQGQILPDRNAPGHLQPAVISAPNGISLVNIQTPSAGGVSRNAYEKFDVLRDGLILNNSRTAVQTQLGGWVTGNANLGAKSASVILNEVNTSTPSLLQGTVELAGQRAQVIIANPAGITCDSCGFINAQRATLTTGQPIINNGNLDGYRVTKGTLRIDGAGLNSASADYTDLIARAVTLNAGVWAGQLRITTGTNTVNTANTQATPLPAGSEKPAFALDVAQLGGMYAGKIYLIGTEAGLGVRNSGMIGAGAGEVVLRVDGRLENRAKIYGDHIAIAASDIINAPGDTSDTTSANSAAPVIAARKRLDVGTDKLINRKHALMASLGDIAIGAALNDTDQASGQASLVENASATIDATQKLVLSAREVRNLNLNFSTGNEEVRREQLTEYTSPASHIRYSSTDPRVYPIHDEIWKLMTPEGMLEPWTKYEFERITQETQIKTTDPGRIIAGGGIQLSIDKLRNDHSQFLAGADITGKLGTLENIDTPGQRIITDTGKATNFWRRHRSGADATETSTADYGPVTTVTGIDLKAFSFQQNAVASVAAARGGSGDVIRNPLFRQSPDPATGYLVETDPAFINYRQWLASDYLLRQLSVDPDTVQKRLGDGFYEQQRVREQIAQLTGRRFMEGYASDETQYQALMNQAVTFAQAHHLRPGIALSKEQVAALTSDIVWLVEEDVTLPDGEQHRALVPRVYVVPRDGDLNAQGALLAGQRIRLDVSGDIVNSGTIAGRQLLTLTADNLRNQSGRITGTEVAIGATNNIENMGGTINATQSLVAAAGRDIEASATTHSSESASRSAMHSRTTIERVAGLYVSGDKGLLIASAGRDLNLSAAAVINQGKEGSTLLSAGRDINLDTVKETASNQTTWDRKNWRKDSSSTDTGTQIHTEGSVQMAAGGDINLKAASVTSSTSEIRMDAAGNVAMTTGERREQLDEAHQHKESGTFSSTTRTSRDIIDQRSAETSTVSGQRVHIHAGQQISITGSDIVSTDSTTLTAGTHIAIEAAAEQREETHIYKEKTSGLTSSGGFGLSVGTRKQSSNAQNSEQHTRAATLGSTDGNVQMIAGADYRQRGSDVLAPKSDVSIAAQRIDITEAHENRSTHTQTRFEQSGITVAVSNPVITAVQTAQQMSKAASQTSDSRMKALAAANTAMTTASAVDAVAAGQGTTINGKENQIVTQRDAAGNPTETKEANAADRMGGISVNVSLGSSNSRSNNTSTTDTASASRVQAGGDIDITAKGAGTDSDLIVQGSALNAGKRLSLAAESEISLRGAANTSEQHSDNDSSSRSVGVGMNLGVKGGVGVTIAASQGKGHGDDSELSWTNTHAQAGEQTSLRSGSDTNIIGAVVTSPQITADIGGHLNITSLQDTSSYESKQQSIGGSVTIGSAPSGNLSLSRSKIDSDYTSVKEQSALRAGDNGFDITVAGNTNLKGGAITSTETAHASQRNQYSTGGTLSTEDLQNRAHYEASAYSVNIGSGFSAAGKLAPSGTGAGIGKESDNASSMTRAAITGAAGDINARTGDKESGIAKIFDVEKVQREINAQVQITQTFTQEAYKSMNHYIDEQRAALVEKAKSATTDEKKQEAQRELNDLNKQEHALNILIGLVTGMAGSALTKEALSAAAGEMRELMVEDSKKFAGITDGKTTLTNFSGESEGIRKDGVKVGGVRVDLDVICGRSNERCEKNTDDSLKLDEQGKVQFNPRAANNMSLEDFLKSSDAEKMIGPTGGIQGMKGSLFGVPYEAGSWQDKLIEAFSGTHDTIGGKITGLYDDQGNIKRGMKNLERNTYDYAVTTIAIIPTTPFALATALPPEIWQAISVILEISK